MANNLLKENNYSLEMIYGDGYKSADCYFGNGNGYGDGDEKGGGLTEGWGYGSRGNGYGDGGRWVSVKKHLLSKTEEIKNI